MRRAVLTAVCLLALVPAAADASRTASGRCPRLQRGLLAADRSAQVYRVVNKEGPFPEAFGCAGGKAYDLGGLPERGDGPGSGGGIRSVVLAGSTVAFEASEFGEVGWSRWVVVIRSLSNGRILHEVPTGPLTEPHPNPESAGIGPVESLVVKSEGSAAWVAEDQFVSGTGPRYYELNAVDKNGTRTVAAGTAIAPHSLALAGSTIYWLQEGRAMSATLD